MALGNGAEMRNVMALTSKQRAYLGGCASTMDPIFHIGKASLTPEIITALDEALEKRELIKVAVLKNCIDDPREIAAVTAERTRSEVVKFLQTIFSRAGKQSIYMEQMQREKILEGYDS